MPGVNIDKENKIATLSLEEDESKLMIVNSGKSQWVDLPDYGEVKVKLYNGKVTIMDVTEKYDFQQ